LLAKAKAPGIKGVRKKNRASERDILCMNFVHGVVSTRGAPAYGLPEEEAGVTALSALE
jgi:hypothetical protein